jgi:AcrR family transcriptional regulator
MTRSRQDPGRADTPLWFAASPDPDTDSSRRPALTRERVVAEALDVISTQGVEALTMRSLATRLGVVPGALYRHVRNKGQLHDLVLDEILAEVDVRIDTEVSWTDQITTLAQQLRSVLEGHPGVAGLLKHRAPLTPHSLALAESFLAPLQRAGLSGRQAALAYHLIHDYTVGFALSDRASAGEVRLRDPTTREQLRDFLRTLPAHRFPHLAALGELIWIDNRDTRFSANLRTLLQGLQTAATQEDEPRHGRPDRRGPVRPRGDGRAGS